MDLNYATVGATDVAERHWSPARAGFRTHERSVVIGHRTAAWEEAATAVMAWGVKTRSGFEVVPAGGADRTVRLGQDYTLVAHVGPLRIREPVQVVATVREHDRCGFAYGTGRGHPVSGEEAFVVWTDERGRVWLTLRSLTRPSTGIWRVLFPAILMTQRWFRFRYQRALCGPESRSMRGRSGRA
ncbi:MAG TPA: DUF1990 family protein [Nocardioides sp.]|nr:DUF1990 family protein [Nocardioides sp.]